MTTLITAFIKQAATSQQAYDEAVDKVILRWPEQISRTAPLSDGDQLTGGGYPLMDDPVRF